MADIYDRARATAIRMLAPRSKGSKGLEMTLTRTVAGEYDPEAGGATSTITDYLGSAFRDTYSNSDIDGTLIKAGDVKFLVSPALLDGSPMPTPATTDTILFDSQRFTVESVKPWNYAGVDIGFEVQARK